MTRPSAATLIASNFVMNSHVSIRRRGCESATHVRVFFFCRCDCLLHGKYGRRQSLCSSIQRPPDSCETARDHSHSNYSGSRKSTADFARGDHPKICSPGRRVGAGSPRLQLSQDCAAAGVWSRRKAQRPIRNHLDSNHRRGWQTLSKDQRRRRGIHAKSGKPGKGTRCRRWPRSPNFRWEPHSYLNTIFLTKVRSRLMT